MNLEMRFRSGDDVRAVWLLAVGVFLCGSWYIQARYQTAIAASRARTQTLYRQTVSDVRIVRDSAALRTIRDRAQADLARVSQDTSVAGTTASLLAMLQASARAFDARVLEVRPGNAGDAQTELRATPVTIRIRGRFRGVVAFIEDLSHHRTLISVSETEMNVANGAATNRSEPQLDATIHAMLYRLATGEKDPRIASAR